MSSMMINGDLDMLDDDSVKAEESAAFTFIESNLMDDNIVPEAWLNDGNIYQSEMFEDMLKLDQHFELMEEDGGGNLTAGLAIPSSAASDSGMSSAQSFSCEQQLSPMLTGAEDTAEQSYAINSPVQYQDLDSVASDSPLLSSSGFGSPENNATIEMVPEEVELKNALIHLMNPEASNQLPANDQSHIYTESAPEKVKIASAPTTKRNVRQVIRVTPVGSGNPRSILLPVSLVTGSRDMKQVRTIKIVNAAQAENLKNLKMKQNIKIKNVQQVQHKVHIQHEKEEEEEEDDSSSSEEKGTNSSNQASECESPYPRLKLNSEEKRLLQKEGINLPSHYPLTKQEERELKRIRRKIRNKISAQDSRKRKKEYVDGLEDRVKQCHEENVQLLKRINDLQKDNQSLVGQVKRLQAFIQKENRSAQPSTCLLVLLLSLALVAVPSLKPPHSSSSATSNELSAQEPKHSEKMPLLTGRSRNLLSTRQFMEEELQHYGEELLLQDVEGLLDHDYGSVVQVQKGYKKARYDLDSSKLVSADHVGGTLVSSLKMDDGRKFIDPPVDDYFFPPKPGGNKNLDKLETLTNELKLNISDMDATRTVVVKVAQEQ